MATLLTTPAGAATGDLFRNPTGSGRFPSNPRQIAFSPNGQSVYVAAGLGVAIFDRDPATGALTQKDGTAGCMSPNGLYQDNTPETEGECAIGRGIGAAAWVAVSPDGRNVYFGGNRVAVFDRDLATGALTQKAGILGCVAGPGSAGTCTTARVELAGPVIVSPDGRNLYTGTGFGGGGVAVLTRDPTSGALAQSAGASGCVVEVGDTSTCADGKALSPPNDLTITPDGKGIYVASAWGQGAVTALDRDLGTGALTQKAGDAACVVQGGDGLTCVAGKALDGASSATVTADGRSVYVASTGSDAIAVFARDTATGALTQKSGIAGCISQTGTPSGPVYACREGAPLQNPKSVRVSPDGLSVYVGAQVAGTEVPTNVVTWFDRDPHTGALTHGGCVSDAGSGGLCTQLWGFTYVGVNSVAPSQDGRHVYAGARSIVSFDRELAPDADGDGVPDVVDLCPAQAGPVSDRGCPTGGAGSGLGTNPPLGAPPAQLAQFAGCPARAANVIRGTAAANTITGTAKGDRIFSGAGKDMVDAGAGDDCVDLGAGNDSAQGGPGADLILGGAGNDRMRGAAGNDSITGGAGRDRIAAGSGNDRISVRDGSRDVVNCSGGRDVVVADRKDRVARNCERVRRR